ncbi:DUF305 domain-containing protein [Roseomonas sp. WA12]
MPRHGIRSAVLAGAAALLIFSHPVLAMVGEGADEGIKPVTSPSYTLVPEGRLAAARKADLDYVTGMRPHHAGALTMSEEYLADPEARSPILRMLAQAIIHNQRFEIALLDEVARKLAQPAQILDLGFGAMAVQPAGTEGMALPLRFTRFPVPGPLVARGPMAVRDVQFAKGMITHHQAALTMALDYQAGPDARNSFLRLFNVDIITDQTQEIGLMRRILETYPGDTDAVTVPASMIHGMEGMSHGSHAAQQDRATFTPANRGAPPSAHTGHSSAPVNNAPRRRAVGQQERHAH